MVDIIETREGDNMTDDVEQQDERDFKQLGQTEEDIDTRIELVQATASGFKSGMMLPWAGLLKKIPDDWKLCDGTAVSRSEFSGLFTAIGTQWGSGDGSTTFALPNLTQRFIQGIDTATTEPGTTGGATSKAVPATASVAENKGTGGLSAAAQAHTHTISDIRPKFAEVAFIIKT